MSLTSRAQVSSSVVSITVVNRLNILTIGSDDTNHDSDWGSRLQIEHDGETVELTEVGVQEPLDTVRELQTHVGRLGQILEFLAS